VGLRQCVPRRGPFPAHCERLDLRVELRGPNEQEVRVGLNAGSPMHMLGARIVVLVVRATPGATPRFRWVGRGFRFGPRHERDLPTPDAPDRP
jgi:hypothetical protein